MSRKSVVRILVFIFIFILQAVLPWWLTLLILLGLTIYYPLYLEVLFFGFLFDTLYSPTLAFPYVGLLSATAFLILVYFAKTYIRTS